MQAQDIMRSEVQCVSETTTLRELSHAFRQYGVTTLAVIDDKNHLVGVVNEDDLLRAMMPSYSELQDNLNYMQDFEYLEDRAQEVESLPVRDIMIRGTISVPPRAPLLRLVSLFLLKSYSHIPVVEKNQIVGMVTRADICELLFN
ncbi:MAG: CBS domain-containing protein [Anaerolineae bacterium]|nr:CBS domain-containing protein [Anaerolineae bacterium]